MCRYLPLLTLLTILLLPGAVHAQVQPNSPEASLTVNGRALDGFSGDPRQDLIPGTVVTFLVSGEPYQPVVLAQGTAREPGAPLLTYGLLNLLNYTLIFNGLDPTGFGQFAWTGPDGTLSVSGALSPDIALGTEVSFQAAVGTSGPAGMVLSAPETIVARLPRVLYRSTEETGGWSGELFGSNTFGTSRVKLHAGFGQTANVTAYSWSSDGSHAAYIADQNFDTLDELFVSQADGTGNHLVNGPLIPVGDVRDFAWSPDSSRLAYRADQDLDEVFELYVVNADGSGVVKMNPVLPAGGDVSDYQWSPDSSQLAVRAGADNPGLQELYVVQADGTGWVKVSGVVDWSLGSDYLWSLDGSMLILRPYFSGLYEVRGADPSGASTWTISDPLGASVSSFSLAPGGSKVGYLAGGELFTSNLDGTANVRVSNTLAVNGDVMAYAWSHDSSRIAYRADEEFDGRFELYANDAAPALPESAVKVNGFLTPNGDVESFAWAPDDSKIAYRADQMVNDQWELFVSNPDGTGNLRLNGALVSDVTSFAWSPASDILRIAYLADETTNSGSELYGIGPDGSGKVLLGEQNISSDYEWDVTGRWCAFRTSSWSLHVNDRMGQEELELDSTTANGVSSFAWSPVP